MTPKTLAKKISEAALGKKAHDVVIIDLRKLTSMTDFFVLCSADSDTQARAIADAVKVDLEKQGELPWKKEGYSEGRWILIDYVHVVVHIFHKETRSFYNIEKLWGDAKFEYVDDEPTPAEKKKTTAVKTPKKKSTTKHA